MSAITSCLTILVFYNHPASSISKAGRELLKESIRYSLEKQKYKWLAQAIIKAKIIEYETSPKITEIEGLRYEFNSFGQLYFLISEQLLAPKNDDLVVIEKEVSKEVQPVEIINKIESEKQENIFEELSSVEITEVEQVLTETYSTESITVAETLPEKKSHNLLKRLFKQLFGKILKIFSR